ncbi:ScbR family autoregulator-binding transcription factor [Streptomyces lancefieldiae]|uniref:ScbR family autoregulator-binding transcription factor n=1 Tax=Streptomyces lancefieldiae TaxID=3075520 RepID=A0ABU3AVA2_9ACTN|nr:ScbR family autoregulator-binding transcription factor [Streptomyces sp. DSM 40712]MDT0612751.1 ScbR family autoregulator-binding transcription factor [Streptomyces sp. DSM 40712]
MAAQERAIRTRHNIMLAAATVFNERGYKAATIADILAKAGVTKGALYFHFPSKDELAQEVLAAQNRDFSVPDRPSKTQEVVDIVMLHTHRLQSDPMVRAAVRLTMDQLSTELDRTGPFRQWSDVTRERLEKAGAQGELLPHVLPGETSDVLVGSYAGVQSMSHALSEYQDLPVRVNALLRHLLPSIVLPSVLASVDIAGDRGARVHAEMLAA